MAPRWKIPANDRRHRRGPALNYVAYRRISSRSADRIGHDREILPQFPLQYGMIACSLAPGLSLFWKIAAAAVLAVIPVRVTTSSGETIEAKLQGLTETTLLLDGESEIHFDDVVSLQQIDFAEKTPPTFGLVTLLGGSKITVQDLSFSDDTLVLEPRRQKPLRVNAKEVKAIRFRPSSPSTDPQWLGLLEQEGRGDVLAIRRDGNRMDPYRGVIRSIGDNKVGFDLDEDTIGAPIEKLEGVIFGSSRRVNESAKIKVTDVYGSVWFASKVLPAKSGPLKLQLSGPIVHEIPLQQIESIQWTSGVQALAPTELADRSYQPFFDTKLDPEFLGEWFGPVADGESDLLLQGESWVEYRVEPGFTKLAGSVRRDPSVQKAGNVTVRILVDGQVRWEEPVEGADPLGFDLAINGGRRIRIEVDSGEDGDLGDTIRITRPRLMK